MNQNAFKQFNGPALLAEMFRELDPITRKKFLDKLEKASPILAKTIDYLEFQYWDLSRVEDAGLQYLLRLIPEANWLVAWKLTPKALKDRLLANMSERKREDFEASAKKVAKMHKAQVFKVQMQIALQAKTALSEGKIKLVSRRPIQEYQARLAEKIRELSQRRAVKKPA